MQPKAKHQLLIKAITVTFATLVATTHGANANGGK